MIFSEQEALLSLYNGMSGKQYDAPEGLEIVTLENAIYMNRKNDLAFLIDCTLNLYEQQSTDSPNLPMRSLFYISREFEKLIIGQSLYSSKRILVPTPRFIVFYNGNDTSWDTKEMKLSDAFEQKTDCPDLELKVTWININLGNNKEFMKNCKTLFEYSSYVDKVRKYNATMNIRLAVEKAVNECIKEGTLKDFLLKNKAEAIQMSIFEYDEEREMNLIRRDEREIGREEGLREGMQKGMQKGIKSYILDNLEEHVSEDRIITKLQKIFGVLPEEGRQLVSSFRQAK